MVTKADRYIGCSYREMEKLRIHKWKAIRFSRKLKIKKERVKKWQNH